MSFLKENILKKNKKDIIILIIIIIFVIIISIFLTKILINKEILELITIKYRTYAYLILIALQIIQTIFTFIPAGMINIAGGAVFGTFWGTLISLTGVVIGSIIVFLISRKFGRKFVEKTVNKKYIEFIDNIKKENIELILLILYLIPIFPNDLFTYIIGITKIKFKDFLIIIIFGRLPIILFTSYYGTQLIKANINSSIYLTIIIVIVSVLVYIFRENIFQLIHHTPKK